MVQAFSYQSSKVCPCHILSNHSSTTTTFKHKYFFFVHQLNQIKTMVDSGSMDWSEVDEHGKTVVHVAAGYRHCHEVGATAIGPQVICCEGGSAVL